MMSLLKITPQTIEFPILLHQSITTTLRLENVLTTSRPVAFKIKTTAPKNYLVRPSTGIIPPDRFQDVQIILQPLTTEPAANSSDRFLVQATPVDDENANPTREFWVTIPKGDVMDQKLHVVFKEASTASASSGATSVSSGTVSSSTASSLAAFSQIPTDVRELTVMHQDLIKRCAELESEKVHMQKDVENLRLRLTHEVQRRPNGGNWDTDAAGRKSSSNQQSSTGMIPNFEIWHVIPVVIFFIIILKLLGYF